MRKSFRSHIPRGLALLAISPFLMGFEPFREEGTTVGVGGAYGRGHYSTGCPSRIFQEEYTSGTLAVDYTFHHDSARVLRPQVTLGGRMGMARLETRLLFDSEDSEGDGERMFEVSEPADQRVMVVPQFLLQLDWAYLGLGAGLILNPPVSEKGEFDAPIFPAAELRLGPWKGMYATGSLGSGFSIPVSVPLDLAVGLGWQGENLGLWLGQASSYSAVENVAALSYRFRPFTVIGSMGLLAEDDGTFQGHYEMWQLSRTALGLKFHL